MMARRLERKGIYMVHLILEILIIFTTIGSWVRMFRRGGDRVLSQRGLASLKYYMCCLTFLPAWFPA